MASVVAIGSTHGLEGFALAGVEVARANSAPEAERIWAALDDDVGLVILSPEADEAIRPHRALRPDVLMVVAP